ncbi:peptidoglycan DD-metalloendopeptidase family protein [uncultured Enterovirga sp.]|uniref:peptidoglycan DD-metalloendopeptidase family protein n=1 Tax=uncultured Enterovirga sp. TaxID=2026352 RepID=UPI0035CB7B9E
MIGVVGSLAAACTTDSVRFSETPFANPFASSGSGAEPAMTGSIDEPRSEPARIAPAPRESIRSEPIAPVRSATPSSAPAPAPYSRQASSGPSGWSASGGSSITVGSGDSLTGIANRYGVPSSAILSANGITASQVTAGRRIVIPVYSAHGGSGSPSRVSQAEPERQGRVVSTAKLTPAKAAPPRTMAEATLVKPRVRPGQPKQDVVAKAAPAKEPVKTASRSNVDAKNVVRAAPPAAKVAAAKPAPAPEPVAKTAKVAAQKAIEPAKVAAPAPTKVAVAAPAKATPVETPKPAPKEPESTGAIPVAATGAEFRWPARGRVITGFGGGGSNEGINIAVPDGTPVKAAGDGTVAYAGSEVKGYGNLVLIRHDNGYVSAYAHNGDLDVKRGQKVTRGQTIAKSGQSGNVTSPQLHFEIRKGSTPVDPMKYLASAS